MRIYTVSIALASAAWMVAPAGAQEAAPPAQSFHSSSAPTDDHGLEYRVSKLLGAPVHDASGKRIGDVTDLVISPDGDVTSVVLSIGGFLDVGDRRIEASYDELRVNAAGEIYLPLTEEEIERRPEHRLRTAALAPSAQPPAREPVDPVTQAEAHEEAKESYAGNDPRVEVGIAENKEAFDEENQTAGDAP